MVTGDFQNHRKKGAVGSGKVEIGVHCASTVGTLLPFYNLYCSFINIAGIPVTLKIPCLRLGALVVVQL